MYGWRPPDPLRVWLATKRDDGVDYPASAYLVRPDINTPSDWKIRIKEQVGGEIKVTKAQLGRAAAALSLGGFRGNRVQLPEGYTLGQVAKRLIAEYHKLGVADDDIPASLRELAG